MNEAKDQHRKDNSERAMTKDQKLKHDSKNISKVKSLTSHDSSHNPELNLVSVA